MFFRRGNRKRAAEPKIRLPQIDWVRIAGFAGSCLAVALVVAGGRWLLDRPIERVLLNGKYERVSADQLEAAVRPLVGAGFMGSNLAKIQQAVDAIPWIAQARVSRRWPSTLEITVVEEEPAARWGRDGLLNRQGRLFVAHTKHIPAELPRLSGPEGSESEVAARFVAIQDQLVQRGLSVVAVSLDDRGALSFRLSNGIDVRLGAGDVDRRLALFYRAFDEVVANVADDVDFVDMRYANGFSIGWRAGHAAPVASAGSPASAGELLPNA